MSQHVALGAAWRVALVLPWPPSGNHAWRSGTDPRTGRRRWYKSAAYKKFIAEVQGIVLMNRANAMMVGRLRMSILWIPPDRRKRDLSNVVKTLEDALTKSGVWVDDSQVRERTERSLDPQRGGRVQVLIERIE